MGNSLGSIIRPRPHQVTVSVKKNCETCMFLSKSKECTRFYKIEPDGHYNYDSAVLVLKNNCKGRYHVMLSEK